MKYCTQRPGYLRSGPQDPAREDTLLSNERSQREKIVGESKRRPGLPHGPLQLRVVRVGGGEVPAELDEDALERGLLAARGAELRRVRAPQLLRHLGEQN